MSTNTSRRINVNNGKQLTMLERVRNGNTSISFYIETKNGRTGATFIEHSHVKEFYLNNYTLDVSLYKERSIYKEIKEVTGKKFNDLNKRNIIDFILHTLKLNNIEVTDSVNKDIIRFFYKN